jgi:hypothetical protein
LLIGTSMSTGCLPTSRKTGAASRGSVTKSSPDQVRGAQLIGSSTTDTRLKVCCEIDGNLYPKGVKVSDQEMVELDIKGNAFHHQWNATIARSQQPP